MQWINSIGQIIIQKQKNGKTPKEEEKGRYDEINQLVMKVNILEF